MDLNEIVDFSFSLEPKRFRINDDIFECAPELPLSAMAQAAHFQLKMQDLRSDPDAALRPIFDFFNTIMLGDSFTRFRARFDDVTRPIGVRHILKIMPWIVEAYGLVPTQPPSSSSPSLDGTGTTSTAGAQSAASIHADSPARDSSTSFTTTDALAPSVS